jgi:anti-sigma regulatory factor (Ser/Thr protein kinase)
MARTTAAEGTEQHRALLYEDADQFLDVVAPFLREGIGGGERVVLALVPEKLAWLRETLGADADGAEFVDAYELYARNGPMLSSLLERLAEPGRVRVVAEQALATRTPAEIRAFMRYEAAANVAYRPYAASVLCPYDVSRLPDAVLERAQQTHPHLVEGHAGRASDRFMDPREFIRRHSHVEPPPADAVELALEGLDDLAPIRHRVARLAQAAGLAQARIDELTVAVTELVANALVHGSAPRRVWTYTVDGAFTCHVQDAGKGLPDPLAGYLMPDTTGAGGRGLWLANQLCDTVEASTNHTGTHLCVRMTL